MAVNDVAQVRVVGAQLASQRMVVLHFRFKSAGASLAGLLAELEATTTTFRDLFIASMSNTLTWTLLEGQMLIPFGAASQQLAISPVWTGTDAGQPSPPADALVITKRTDLIGRSRRGRMYLPGLTTNSHAGAGVLTGAFLATKATNIANLHAVYDEGGTSPDYEHGVWSRLLAGPTPPFSFSAYQAVDTMIARSEIRTQRRRQVGVGA